MPTKPDDMSPAKHEQFVKNWMTEISDALKREKKYREKAQPVVEIYEGKRSDETPFNIIYSNTEVLIPSVYNARPIPIVTRRFKDADPVGKAAAEVSTRLLKFLIDTESDEYEGFDDNMQSAVLNGTVTNRGLNRFKFVAHEGKYSECVYGEDVRWDKFFHGYARSWRKVPWIGFEWDMSKEDIKKNFPNVDLDFKNFDPIDRSEDPNEDAEDRDELIGVTTYKVYEIWDKRKKRVYFFSGCAKKEPLRNVPDPLELSGFFPVPKPINFSRKITTLVPTTLYEQYKQQAQELNDITRRLKAIIKAIRYRGAYNSTVEGIEKMLEAEDNQLVPVENISSMPDTAQGMDKLLYIVPVHDLVQTAQSLYQQRESCKQVIYEITGISDILRGASVASETATAQNLKNQWGSLRLKKMQKEVQRYCRESLAIMLEIAVAKFEQKTIQAMTGLPFLTKEQKDQIQMQQMMQQQMAQRQQMVAQATGQPAPQQQPPQLPPEVQELLKAPTWEDILEVLKNDVTREYKTDIETNSTIDAEASQDKQDISELLIALGQFFQSIGPLVQDGTLPFEIAQKMLLTITRRYNFGSELEDELLKMAAPQPKEDPAQAIELQVKQEEAKAKQAQSQIDMQRAQMEFENEKQLMALKMQVEQAELEIKRQELAMQKEQMQMKMDLARQTHQLKLQQLTMQAALKPSNGSGEKSSAPV